MVVLGIDTATWTASVGVVRDDVVLAETVETTAQSHVSSLPRLVETALARARLGWPDVEGLAVSIGPGSFTGLRIGLSLVKGIAYAGGLPVAAVSTLEALAHVVDATPGETVWTALDARMREVYAASFERVGSELVRRSPDEALAPDVLAGRIGAGSLLVGDAADAYPVLRTTPARMMPFATNHPSGAIVARLGGVSLRAGRAADIGSLEPAYVRPPQAELARGPSR